MVGVQGPGKVCKNGNTCAAAKNSEFVAQLNIHVYSLAIQIFLCVRMLPQYIIANYLPTRGKIWAFTAALAPVLET